MGDLGRQMDLEEAVAGEFLRGLGSNGSDAPQGSQYGTSDEADWGRYGQQPPKRTTTWVPPPKKPPTPPPPQVSHPLPQRPTLPSRPLLRPAMPIPPQVLAIAEQAKVTGMLLPSPKAEVVTAPPVAQPLPSAEVVNLPPVIERPRAEVVEVPDAAPPAYAPAPSPAKSLEYTYSWDPEALARLQAAKAAQAQRLRQQAPSVAPSLADSAAQVVDNLTYGPQLPRAEVVEVPEPSPRAETVAVPQAPSPEGYRDPTALDKAVRAQIAGNAALRTVFEDNIDRMHMLRAGVINQLLVKNVPLTLDDALTIYQSVKTGDDKYEAAVVAANIKKSAEEFSFWGRKPLTWVANLVPSEAAEAAEGKKGDVIFHEVLQATLDRLSKKFLNSGLTAAEKESVTAALRTAKAQNIPLSLESVLPLMVKALSDKVITASGGNLTPIAPADQVGISYDWDPGEGRSGPAETRAMRAYSQVTKPFEMMFGRVTKLQDFIKKMKQILQIKGKGFKAPAQEYFELKYGKALFALYSGANTAPGRDWSARQRYDSGQQLRDLWNAAIKDVVETAFDKAKLDRELPALRAANVVASRAEAAQRGPGGRDEGDVWQQRQAQQAKPSAPRMTQRQAVAQEMMTLLQQGAPPAQVQATTQELRRLRGLGYFGQFRIPRPLG